MNPRLPTNLLSRLPLRKGINNYYCIIIDLIIDSMLSNKKLRTSNEKVEESAPFLHKGERESFGNGTNSIASINGSSSSSAKEEKEKEKEREKEKDKEKEKSAGTGSKKDDDYYDRESDNETGTKIDENNRSQKKEGKRITLNNQRIK